jgi:hypothetical protein
MMVGVTVIVFLSNHFHYFMLWLETLLVFKILKDTGDFA